MAPTFCVQLVHTSVDTQLSVFVYIYLANYMVYTYTSHVQSNMVLPSTCTPQQLHVYAECTLAHFILSPCAAQCNYITALHSSVCNKIIPDLQFTHISELRGSCPCLCDNHVCCNLQCVFTACSRLLQTTMCMTVMYMYLQLISYGAVALLMTHLMYS